jgi:histidine triad (HIT) family protein
MSIATRSFEPIGRAPWWMVRAGWDDSVSPGGIRREGFAGRDSSWDRNVNGWENGRVDPANVRSDRCAFCSIVDGHEPDAVVFESETSVAFLDRRPLFHGHTLVVPRRHVVTLAELAADDIGPFWLDVQHISRAMPELLGAQGTFVANNNAVSQSVAHLHVHVVPRTKGDGLRGFFWPRTSYADGEALHVAGLLRRGLTAASQ